MLASPPVFRVVPETLASTLGVVVQLYGFCGVLLRHSNAVQTVTGAAYPAAPTYT